MDKTKWVNSNIVDSCDIQLGTRIVKKYAEEGCFPVYGGGGATFTTNTYNRENAILVSRFALSKECTRFVSGKFYLNDSGLTLVPKNESKSIIFDFLKWQIFSLNDKIYSLARGAAQKNLDMKRFPLLPILVPTLLEQQAIASEFDVLQTMIDGYKAQIADLDALAQSIFLNTFGDPVSNPKGWEKVSLGELGEISSGGTPSRSNLSYYKGDIDWYSAGELNQLYLNGSNEKITEEAITESSAKLFKPNSLFIGLYDTAAFKLGITLKEASSNQACANLYLTNDSIIWIYYCLLNMKEYAWTFRKGVRQKNLTVGFVKMFSIPHPPLVLQQQFATQVEAIEKQKELFRQQLADAETLMAERMQYYFF